MRKPGKNIGYNSEQLLTDKWEKENKNKDAAGRI